MGDQARQAHRVDRLVHVASGRRDQLRGALCRPRRGVELRSWWSSTISHSGMCGAISCAASIISTAPIAKLGATKQFAPSSRLGRPGQRSSSNPVVPTTA